MKEKMTREQIEKRWDTATAILNNLKGWSWDVIPQIKIEEEEAAVIIEALEHLSINIMLPEIKSVKIDAGDGLVDEFRKIIKENPITCLRQEG